MGRFDLLTQLETKPVQPPPSGKQNGEHQFASKPANQQTDKEANQHGGKTGNQQTCKPASQQVGLPENQQTSKEASLHPGFPASQHGSKVLKKFSSYLAEGSLKQLKRMAFETDRKDYEVLQEAVDEYLQKK